MHGLSVNITAANFCYGDTVMLSMPLKEIAEAVLIELCEAIY